MLIPEKSKIIQKEMAELEKNMFQVSVDIENILDSRRREEAYKLFDLFDNYRSLKNKLYYKATVLELMENLTGRVN